MTWIRRGARMVLAAMTLAGAGGWAQDAKTAIDTLIHNEEDATARRGRYTYMSVEKSDRTGGHTWTERVAETQWGKVRFLIADDGVPISGDRLAGEKARLAQIVADPEAFKRAEAAHNDDEMHARQMLVMLPKAFFFENPVVEGDSLRVNFRPNPAYSPQGMEERVLHGMSGSVLIDEKTMRLRGLIATLPQDVSLAFGLANVKAGSHFDTLRMPVAGIDWKTETVHTAFNGKALFLKTIARQQDLKRSGYTRIPSDISMGDAVKLLEESVN
jgi:hypothetical protein